MAIALVTGTSSGIGLATAVTLARNGHKVIATMRNLDGGSELRKIVSSVMAVVGELEPAGVPQHVGVNEKGEFRGHARPGHHALISGCGKGSATFRDEDVWGCWCFAQELAQARLSRADIGCTLASPPLALRTCKRPVVRSMSSQRSTTTSVAPPSARQADHAKCSAPWRHPWSKSLAFL